ncbi:MAG: ABC transporter substrate-binding protein [Thermodesulfobacteriota bacterium]
MYHCRFKVTILLASVIFLISSHADSKSDSPKNYGDSLLLGDFIEPDIINPILTHSSISAALKRIVFDGLIKLDDRMEPNPHLALSWENSPDGLTWIFHLKRGVKFHDGAELTAEEGPIRT